MGDISAFGSFDREAPAFRERCVEVGCNLQAAPGSSRCEVHKPFESYAGSYTFAADPLEAIRKAMERNAAESTYGPVSTAYVDALELRLAKLEDRSALVSAEVTRMAEWRKDIEKRFHVLDTIRRNEYPFSDLMGEPAFNRSIFQAIKPLLPEISAADFAEAKRIRAMSNDGFNEWVRAEAAKGGYKATQVEVAPGVYKTKVEPCATCGELPAEYYTHQTRPGEWLCRACAKGIMEPTYTGLPVIRGRPWRAGRLARLRLWVNAHPVELSGVTIGFACARIAQVLFL